MISLFFNTKLVSAAHIPACKQKNNYSFYPFFYPREKSGLSQLDVLIGVIDSYSSFFFQNAVLNIDLTELDDSDSAQELLNREILKKINVSSKLIINYSRPSTVASWKECVDEYARVIGKNIPTLVVMNHDHPFVDYTTNVFNSAVEEVFDCAAVNFKKVLLYSHAPEGISTIINQNDSCISGSLGVGCVYKQPNINYWLDSLYVMTMDTLQYLFDNIVLAKGKYIGRFDWHGVYYKNKLNLASYATTREFFRHYDGYSHVSGIRLYTELQNFPFKFLFPSDGSINDVVDFYYQRWLDCYLLAIRDSMVNFWCCSVRTRFIRTIERTLNEFAKSYIDLDISNNIVDGVYRDEILCGLTEKVYHNANHIFMEVFVDSKIAQKSIINKITKFIPYKYRLIAKNIFRSFYVLNNQRS